MNAKRRYYERDISGPDGIEIFEEIDPIRARVLLNAGATSHYPVIFDCSGPVPRIVPAKDESAHNTWGAYFRRNQYEGCALVGLPDCFLDELGNMMDSQGKIVLRAEVAP